MKESRIFKDLSPTLHVSGRHHRYFFALYILKSMDMCILQVTLVW